MMTKKKRKSFSTRGVSLSNACHIAAAAALEMVIAVMVGNVHLLFA